jgi:hypothetical protein
MVESNISTLKNGAIASAYFGLARYHILKLFRRSSGSGVTVSDVTTCLKFDGVVPSGPMFSC